MDTSREGFAKHFLTILTGNVVKCARRRPTDQTDQAWRASPQSLLVGEHTIRSQCDGLSVAREKGFRGKTSRDSGKPTETF